MQPAFTGSCLLQISMNLVSSSPVFSYSGSFPLNVSTLLAREYTT